MNNRFRLRFTRFPPPLFCFAAKPMFPAGDTAGFLHQQPVYWEAPFPRKRGYREPGRLRRPCALVPGDSVEMTPAILGGAQLVGTGTHRAWRRADGRAPKAQFPRASVTGKSPELISSPGLLQPFKGRGAAGACACLCVFPAGEQVQPSAHRIKTAFPYSYALFSQVASINGSAQTPVLKMCGFQRNPSEALCAGSDGCGARRDPRGPPAPPALPGEPRSAGAQAHRAPPLLHRPGPAPRHRRYPAFRPGHNKVVRDCRVPSSLRAHVGRFNCHIFKAR